MHRRGILPPAAPHAVRGGPNWCAVRQCRRERSRTDAGDGGGSRLDRNAAGSLYNQFEPF